MQAGGHDNRTARLRQHLAPPDPRSGPRLIEPEVFGEVPEDVMGSRADPDGAATSSTEPR